jgi:hypothetical protein
MMCAGVRCQNLANWPAHLHRDFFNWLCHKTADIGFCKLELQHGQMKGLGNPTSAAFRDRVRLLVFDACDTLPPRFALSRAKMAHHAFYLAYLARDTRHPGPDSIMTVSICNEHSNGGHTYERELMRALYDCVEEWVQFHT